MSLEYNTVKPKRISILHTKVIRKKHLAKFRIMSGCMIMSGGLYDIDQTVQMPELQAFDIDSNGRFHQREDFRIKSLAVSSFPAWPINSAFKS